MSRLTRDETAEPVSRDQILRHAQGQGNIIFPVQLTTSSNWQPYPVDPYSAKCDDHTYIHAYNIQHGSRLIIYCFIGCKDKASTCWYLNEFLDGIIVTLGQ